MKAVVRLLAPFWRHLLAAGLLGGLASVATVLLLAATNHLLTDAAADLHTLAVFAGLCAVVFGGNALADIMTNAIGQQLVAGLRRSLAEKIVAAPVDALEHYRSHRLIPVLTGDVDAISDLAFLIAPLAIAGAVIAGCLAYLAWLAPVLSVLLIVLLGLGSVIVYLARARGIAGFWAARDSEDALHKSYRTLIGGARELRLSRARRSQLLDREMAGTIETIRRVNTRAINLFVVANAAGSTLYFVIIAVVIATGHALAVADSGVLTGYVLVLLYMKGPVEQVMQALPALGRAQVSLRRVGELDAAFATPDAHGSAPVPAKAPKRIELCDVRYRFPAADGTEPFGIGPLNLTIDAGETLFVVGENGAGKTTLLNILLGLYAPHEGEVRVDGHAVTEGSRDAYRQNFSAVLSDYHLFETLPAGSDVGAAQVQIARLGIADKLHIAGDRLSTIDLSTGQRKRLALVHAYLEDRPVIVFDEWAADQDPHFRQMFYEELLPEMKRRGKTLIVISHDDRYFHRADRLVRLACGRIAESGPARPAEVAT